VDEHLLYMHAPALVTVIDSALKCSLSCALIDHLPSRE